MRELRNLIERSLILGALNVSALYQGLSRMQAGMRAGGAGSAGGSEREGASRGEAASEFVNSRTGALVSTVDCDMGLNP